MYEKEHKRTTLNCKECLIFRNHAVTEDNKLLSAPGEDSIGLTFYQRSEDRCFHDMRFCSAGKEANLKEKAKPEIIRQTVLNQHLKSLSLQCFFCV